MEHTAEPWPSIAAYSTRQARLDEAGYERARVCVNACDGIADQEQFINDARSYGHETVSAIVRQRDELFIALTLCQTELRRLSFKDSAIDYALERTAAAIANAKGA